MAVPCTRRLLLIGLLLVLAADIAFGRFLPAAVEQHNLRFKRAADDIFLRDTKDWSKYGIAAGVYLVISLVIYVATFCCALEKNRAALVRSSTSRLSGYTKPSEQCSKFSKYKNG
uniref:Candidate secreted effector n=1 Tax=Meloidogyne incognita TaxID=6306 RepID=A0A914LVI9_MELIC